MENFAIAFDAPVDSDEHQRLAQIAWMGGALVSVRYYLGRLINRNLFRETNKEVHRYLIQFLSKLTSSQGADLIAGECEWQIAEPILRHRVEIGAVGKSSQNQREVAAIEAFLGDPSRSTADLALMAKTTEKQLMRMSTLQLAKTLYDRKHTKRRKRPG